MRNLRVSPGKGPAAALAEEISFRGLCSGALGKQSFVSTLLGASEAPDQLEDFVKWAAGLLSLDMSLRPATRDHIDDLLLSLAPLLRLNSIILSGEEKLRVLALDELILRRLLTLAGQHPVGPADASTPKGAFEILSRLSPVVHLLAIADGPVTAAKRAIRKLPPFGEPLMTFAAFEILRVAAKGKPLTGVLEKTLMTLTVAHRMALLMDLASYIGSAAFAPKQRPRTTGARPV